MSVVIFLKMKQSLKFYWYDDESSDEDSDEKNDDVPGPSKRVRTMTQTKQSDWKWTRTDNNPLIYPLPKTLVFVMMYSQNLKQNHHLNSLFFRLYGTFEKFVMRPVSTQERSLTIKTERS
jgi:hypothetical protein